MSYHELKERFEKLQDTEYIDEDFNPTPYQALSELNDLAEDLLTELQLSERALYLFKRNVPSEVSYFYPKITKDPTVSCFKDNHLVSSQTLDNPDFTKLHKLGLYALSEGDYCIRTTEQIEYIFKCLRVVDFSGCSFYINFD